MPETETTHIWETWESITLKTHQLGHRVLSFASNEGINIDRIAVVPRGGFHIVNIISRQLGLSGDQILSLGLSKYSRDHPTNAGEFKVGQLPSAKDVEDHNVLVADEVCDTGETTEETVRILRDLGAAAVFTAAVHYKPNESTTGVVPDFYIVETDAWVHYPWEIIDEVGTMHLALQEQSD